MGYQKRLELAFQNAPVLPYGGNYKYVLFSDCHRGNGTHNDNFLKNQHLYLAALRQYYRSGFTYIELGDGDELWENRKMEQITEIHGEVFEQLSAFYKKHRLYMIYGNHDMIKKNTSFSHKKCSSFYCLPDACNKPLFPEITFYSGLILKNTSNGKKLYLTHGHQASLLNSTFWPLSRFLVRYFWKPLEQVGILDPTSAAKNYTVKKRTEKKLADWAEQTGQTLITGHTHRPIASPDSSHYLNTGSCVHPYQITCIEIEQDNLNLVKWYMDAHPGGSLFVERSCLTS